MKVILLILLFPAISCLSRGTKDGADVKCKTAGELLPDPYDCSIYYVCDINLSPQMIRCPSGQYFNPDTSQCADASTVPCGEIQCKTPGQLIPDPVDCSKFYVCDLNLNSFQEQCPSGQVFDPSVGVCNSPANVQGHCGGGATTITTASTTPGPTAPPQVQCTYPGEMIPDPYDCQVFYICDADLKPQYRHCGGDLDFNPSIGNCDLPENVVCPGEGTTTSGPTAPPEVQCTNPGEMIPDPYDCQVFYICDADLKPLYRHCGGDLDFNPAIGNCDLPENVICPGEATTSAPTIPPSVQCTTPGEMIPDPNDCQVFYICDANLKPLYRHCGGDLEFNPAIGNCDLAENVDCPGDVLAEKPNVQEPVQVQCSYISQMIAHPYNCEMFYICDLNLVPQSQQCCCELKYNSKSETCDFAKDVVCPEVL